MSDLKETEQTGQPDCNEQCQTEEQPERKEKSPKMKQFLQILKFTGFSAFAGVIQLLSFTILYEWAAWLPLWP